MNSKSNSWNSDSYVIHTSWILLSSNSEKPAGKFRYSYISALTEEMHKEFYLNKENESNDFSFLHKYLAVMNALEWLDEEDKNIVSNLTEMDLTRLNWNDKNEIEEWILQLRENFNNKKNALENTNADVGKTIAMKAEKILELNN